MMNGRFQERVWCASAWCALVVAMVVGFGIPTAKAQPADADRLEKAIVRSGDYLARQVQPGGDFRYLAYLDGRNVAPEYNILRHAGTMIALADYYQHTPNMAAKQAILAAAGFLQRQIGGVDELPEVSAVWSDPRVHRGPDSRKAKLGGTGLGLVALTATERLFPGTVDRNVLRELGNFLLMMQRDDGGFYSIYYPHGSPDGMGRDDRWTSLYYPGEAALGLLCLYELDPDPEWRLGAVESLRYLAHSREEITEVPPDHWALIATQKLWSLKPSSLHERDRALLLRHTTQVVRQMLSEQRGQRGQWDEKLLDGCFSADGRTTPTATRLEGLFAAIDVIPPHDVLQEEIRESCARGLHFLLRCQVESGADMGAIPRAVAPLPPEHPLFTRSFNDRIGEIRIDYVQHALSAMLQYGTKRPRTLP